MKDKKYLDLLFQAIRVSKKYRPRFGLGGEGLTLEDFIKLYDADPFYNWLGLDSPLMYSAHLIGRLKKKIKVKGNLHSTGLDWNAQS